MASDADKAHVQRLLETHKRNLQRAEEKKALFGPLEVPNSVENEIDNLKASIAEIEGHRLPPIIQNTRQAVRNQYDNDIDFIIADSAARNRRQTKLEEKQTDMATQLHELNKVVLPIAADMQDLKRDNDEGKSGRRRNFWLLMLSISLSAAALGFVLWLAFRLT